MPFILPWRRKAIAEHGLNGFDEIQPGDRCYVHYKQMVDKWRANPRWTTAHDIFKNLMLGDYLEDGDDATARGLAWWVFFSLHVLPYEKQKREENGDI